MKNVLIICGKEIKSYFSSPIAYLLMTIFAVIFGYFFFSASAYFVQASMQSQMSGQSQPMEALWQPAGYMRNVVESVKILAS